MVRRVSTYVNGLATSYLEAGPDRMCDTRPLVLLHGGEFGGDAELAWERVIDRLAVDRRVVAPDVLGFGESAKVVDFVDGRGIRLRHVAALCATLGIERADFVGNSMGAVMLLVDAASGNPVLPVDRIVAICGGGEILANEYSQALYEYDATVEGMRRIVRALFASESWLNDEYVHRRRESSLRPGAWEAVAAARFRRPGHVSASGSELDYHRIGHPTLLVEGELDKLKPRGWAKEIASRIPGASSAVVNGAGHCPQLERPEEVVRLIRAFLDDERGRG